MNRPLGTPGVQVKKGQIIERHYVQLLKKNVPLSLAATLCTCSGASVSSVAVKIIFGSVINETLWQEISLIKWISKSNK